MPNWCNNSITITGPAEKILDIWSKAQDPDSGLINAMVPMPAELEGTTAPSDGANWYAWRCENWGTKWDVDLDGLELEAADGTATISGWFDSAWSPPTSAYETFCDENPDCSIEAFYEESGCCFVGKWDSDSGDDYHEYADATSETIGSMVPKYLVDEFELDVRLEEYEADEECEEDEDEECEEDEEFDSTPTGL